MADAAPQVETRYVAAPVRETKQITLPLDSVGMRDIEVRLFDQGGHVQVSVHSPDREIRGALRANLEELIGSLETHGIRAEMAGGREPSPSSPSHAGSAREMSLKDDSGLLQATTRDFDASRQQQQQQQRTPWLPQTESRKPAPRSADAWQQALEASWQTPS
ncbi:MAG: flagellar hook-length control protein FliK [Bryobacterales bacterium]|nr:flagellar hook-length control protein FliK [Bryobacterales bacterium]